MLVDFFDYKYKIARLDPNKSLFKSLQRFIIRTTANYLLPIQYKATSFKKSNRLSGNLKESGNLIVSLTSFPARINHTWKVVESILRQSVKPDRIIIWLSKEQFKDESNIPNSLLKLRSRGCEVYLRDGDLRSHKKYYYTMKEFPNDYCVVMDDDVFYNSKTLETLINLHQKYKTCICCNDADVIMDKNNNVLKYKEWHILDVKKEFESSGRLLPIGVGGVLYPPHSLDKMVLDEKLFMTLCPRADDLWLWAMAKLKGTSFACSDNLFSYLPIVIKNNTTLSTTNLVGGNDEQMTAILNYLDSINKEIR